MNNRSFFRHRLCKWIFAVASALVLFISGVMPANEESTLHQAVSRVAGMTTVHAEDNIASGAWGTCPWVIDANGVLTIGEGTGGTVKEALWSNYNTQITAIKTNGTIVAPDSIFSLFNELTKCTSADLSGFDTRNTTDMAWLFRECNQLESVNLSSFDTRSVRSMTGMFYDCKSLTELDLSSFNTPVLSSTGQMFSGCSRLKIIDMSNFDDDQISYVPGMFANCPSLTTVYASKEFTLSAHGQAPALYGNSSSALFNNNTALVGGSGTKYSSDHVDYKYAHVDDAPNDPGYFTLKTGSINDEFFNEHSPTRGVGTWGTCKWRVYENGVLRIWPGADVSGTPWFEQHHQYIKTIKTEGVIKLPQDSRYAFYGLTALETFNSRNFDISQATDISEMFLGDTALHTVDLSAWDTPHVTNMENMFTNCTNLATIYDDGGFSTEGLSSENYMFIDNPLLVGGKGTQWPGPNATSGKSRTSIYAHIDGGASNPGYFTYKRASFVPKAGQYGEQEDIAGSAATVAVTNLKEGSTAKLYQIIDGYYKDGKLVKYVLMDPDNGKIAAIGDSSKGQSDSNDIITEDEITTIANNIQAGTFAYSDGEDMTVSDTTATANVEPGMYLVLASDPSGEVVYNPAVVAVNITDVNNGMLSAGSVDLSSFFTTSDGSSTKSAYLKYSESGADSKISGSSKAGSTDVVAAKSAYGDTVAKGDTIHFQISDMHIPSFSADYTAPQFSILDTIDDSFAPYSNLKVAVGEADVAAGDSTYTVSANGNAFKIDFASDYLRSLRGTDMSARTVSVSFDTVLNNATLNFAENHNRAVISYSNDPANEDSLRTINKDTYIYTFGIDTNIDSEDANAANTYEFNKVSELFNASAEQWTDQKSANALADATFTLYSDEDCTAVVKTADQTAGTAISDANGHITFTGLDEGTYYLKETSAPNGYGLTDQTYRFTINADLNSDGTLKGYSIAKAYKDATHTDWTDAGTDTYTTTITSADDGSVTNTITRAEAPVAIVNTRLQALPSTGESGLVPIISFGIAAGAIGFAMNKKRKLA